MMHGVSNVLYVLFSIDFYSRKKKGHLMGDLFVAGTGIEPVTSGL